MIILSIILIIIVIINTILQIVFKIFNPFIIGDDIAVLIIAIIYLILIGIKRRTNHPGIVAATFFVFFIGFGVKGYGIMRNLTETGFFILLFVLHSRKSLTMFLCLPKSCKCSDCSC